jgi:hypothetical protein
MNQIEILALLISLLAFFICTPTIAYCFCCSNKTKKQYRIIPSTNRIISTITSSSSNSNSNTNVNSSMA